MIGRSRSRRGVRRGEMVVYDTPLNLISLHLYEKLQGLCILLSSSSSNFNTVACSQRILAVARRKHERHHNASIGGTSPPRIVMRRLFHANPFSSAIRRLFPAFFTPRSLPAIAAE